jgi:hypothetical protein
MKLKVITPLIIFLVLGRAAPVAAQSSVYIPESLSARGGDIPSCTELHPDEKRRSVTLRDAQKSWARVKLSREAYEELTKHEDLETCLDATPGLVGRFEQSQIPLLEQGQLTPGMPLEFALMLLGPPSQEPLVNSFLDPTTGQPATYTTYVWTNQKRRSMLGSALSIAGAATGASAIAGAVVATQAATIATTAAAAAYTVSGLKAAKMVAVQVDGTGKIQTFTAN